MFAFANTDFETVRCKINSNYTECMFQNSKKLTKIYGSIDVKDSTKLDRMFEGCIALESIEALRYLAKNISFQDCPKLNLQTFQTIIANNRNTTAISITVHADVYAKLTGDTSNAAAAALTPEEAAQWQQLVTDAANKQISFVTL